jgi:cytochrome b561
MFQYTVDIEHLVKNAFFENFPEESTNQNNVSTLDATLNMTHITDLYYAVTGNSHFCSKYPHIAFYIRVIGYPCSGYVTGFYNKRPICFTTTLY